MKKSKKLVFFGNERLATGVATTAPTLRSLIKHGYKVMAVVANYSPGRSRNVRDLEIAEVAKKANIALLLPEKLADISSEIKKFGAEAGILVAYGQIISLEIINLFPKGIINIHPSLLPKYRGPTPIESTILTGANETGVSLMKLASKMDAGPLYVQQKIKLGGFETKQELADRLIKTGRTLLLDKLPAILDGSLSPSLQDEHSASYTVLIDKSLGNIDLSLPAEVIERQVRAYAGWPKSLLKIHGQDIVITKARKIDGEKDDELIIKCSASFLLVEELIAPSGRKMSGADFLRGYNK